MENVWQFSPSSLPLLESCVTAAKASNRPSQKWTQLFKPKEVKIEGVKPEINSMSTVNYDSDYDSEATEIYETDDNKDMAKNNLEHDLQLAERIRGVLEISPANQIEYLMERCNNEHLLPFLAEKLTLPCIQKICDDLFHCQNVDLTFVEKFFQQLLPIYLKRDCTLDLLVKAYKIYPVQFRLLMRLLLTDNDMPTKILEQFFLTVSESERSEFLHQISEKEMRSDIFIHHLSTISYLYKTCTKTVEIQNFILNCLLGSSQACIEDKNYGKFMLTFLQSLKGTDFPVNKSVLESLISSHETSFKIACMRIFNNL